MGGYNHTFVPALCRLPRGAGVEEGAGVDLFYNSSLFFTGTPHPGVDEGAGVEEVYTGSLFYTGTLWRPG